jgi:hypothetical protein
VQLQQQSVLQHPHYYLHELRLVLRVVQRVHLLADGSWQGEVTHHLYIWQQLSLSVTGLSQKGEDGE